MKENVFLKDYEESILNLENCSCKKDIRNNDINTSIDSDDLVELSNFYEKD